MTFNFIKCWFKGHDWLELSHENGWNLFHVVNRVCMRCGQKQTFAERWGDGLTDRCDGSLEP